MWLAGQYHLHLIDLLLFVVGVLDRPRDEDGLTFHTETIIWKSFSN
jgi:hypothetical protein